MYRVAFYLNDGDNDSLDVESEEAGRQTMAMIIQLGEKNMLKASLESVVLLRDFFNRETHKRDNEVIETKYPGEY